MQVDVHDLHGPKTLVLQVSIPALEAGLAAYYILAMSEASSNLSRYDGIRYGRRSQVRRSSLSTACGSLACISSAWLPWTAHCRSAGCLLTIMTQRWLT